MQETWIRSLSWEDPLEKGMAIWSSILAWRVPRTEEPGGLQSVGLQSQTWLSNWHTHTHTPYAGRQRTRNWTSLDHIWNQSSSTHCCLYTVLMLAHILYSIFVIGQPSTTYIVTLYLPISQIPEHLMLRQMIKTFLSSKNNLLQPISFLELWFTTCFLG